LLIDSYANYFCQKFFGYLEYEDKLIFLKNIKDSIVTISNSKVGTYPLQAIFELIRTEPESQIIINSIKNVASEMYYDAQGVHVLEKIIICFDEDLISFLYENIITNFMSLANNCNGLCLVKKNNYSFKKGRNNSKDIKEINRE